MKRNELIHNEILVKSRHRKAGLPYNDSNKDENFSVIKKTNYLIIKSLCGTFGRAEYL